MKSFKEFYLNRYPVLYGTHRLGKAIEGGHETIPVRIIPIEHLEGFRI